MATAEPLQTARPIPIPTAASERDQPSQPVKFSVKRSLSISSIKYSSRIPSTFHNPSHPLELLDTNVNQYCSFDCTTFDDSDCEYTFDDDDDESKLSLSIESRSSVSSFTPSNNWLGSGSRPSLRQTPPVGSRQRGMSISTSTSPPPLILPIKSSSSNQTTHTTATSTLAGSPLLESVSRLRQASRRPSRSLASNLSESLKNIQSSVRKRTASFSLTATFKISPRMTDDIIPTTAAVVEKELETFQYDGTSPVISEPTVFPRFKNRDQRVNPDFLRLYALDYSARLQGRLPIAHTNSELETLQENEVIKRFHEAHDLFKILNASKEKLWRAVILSPRPDKCPRGHIESIFVSTGEVTLPSNGLVRASGAYKPWSNGIRCIQPSGILHGAKLCINGHAPSSGVSRAQYTAKGWSNPRWLAKA